MILISLLMLKLQPTAVKVRVLSSRKSSKTTLLFCLQLLLINASTQGSSQLQTEVYKNTRHTKVWYNSKLLATILNPQSIFKTPSPFYVPKHRYIQYKHGNACQLLSEIQVLAPEVLVSL